MTRHVGHPETSRIRPGARHNLRRRHRRDPQGGAEHRRELRISPRHRQGRIEPQSEPDGANVVGDRPVPVHRADLARRDEAGRQGARIRTLCRRHLAQQFHRPLPGNGPGDARRNHATAQGSRGQCRHGGRLHAAEFCRLGPADRAATQRRRALYRAFLRARRRREADRQRPRYVRRPMPLPCFQQLPAPTARSSTTGKEMHAASPVSMPSSTAAIR